jgi:hypothetical protein
LNPHGTGLEACRVTHRPHVFATRAGAALTAPALVTGPCSDLAAASQSRMDKEGSLTAWRSAIFQSMPEPQPFVVDISSPQSIEVAGEQAIQELERARAELAAARDNVRRWEAIYDRLKLLVGAEDGGKGDTIRAATVKIVNERARATKADDVIEALGGDVERKSVNWALWDAARSGEIKKVSMGIYVPLTYEGNELDALLETVAESQQTISEIIVNSADAELRRGPAT